MHTTFRGVRRRLANIDEDMELASCSALSAHCALEFGMVRSWAQLTKSADHVMCYRRAEVAMESFKLSAWCLSGFPMVYSGDKGASKCPAQNCLSFLAGWLG